MLPQINTPERGVVIIGLDGRIMMANKRASEIFGLSIDQQIGSPLPATVTNRALTFDEIIEEVINNLSDNNKTFHRYSGPVYSSNGTISARMEIYSDITARRELEKEILERNNELAELNIALQDAQEQLVQAERLRALGEMAAGVAHDINNVLGIILGNAQLGIKRVDYPEKVMQCLKAIELASRDAAETIHRLREIGKPIDEGSYQVLNLSDIVEELVKAALPAWAEAGSHGDSKIEVQTHLTPNCKIRGNASEIREALANIILNSAQAIEKQGKIEIYVISLGNYIELSVEDNGVGMSEETKKRLFDPFFTTREPEGTGLGMSMVDAIVIRHRGKVMVSSTEGEGTRITIKFPKT